MMTISRFFSLLGGIYVSFSMLPALAGPDQDAIDAIVAALPEVSPKNISATPVNGLYEIRTGAQILYASADGRYLIQGEIVDVESEENLTEKRRRGARMDAIDDLGESSMIVFSPAKVQHTITVFTDIDCGYCRKLHRQIGEYNDRGIEVRYLFFPRSGPDTDSWFKANKVWCSQDRNTALTRAKAGELVNAKDCGVTPVASHFNLGKEFGIRGTPAILTEEGELIGGYVPPAELAKYLN